MAPVQHQRLSRTLGWAACAAGTVHAAFSLYWAFGGRWLLSTVGNSAVDYAARAPLEAGLLLGTVGIVKLLAAATPVAVIYGQVPWPRFWRAVCWIGGMFLVLYGAANTAAGAAVLAGVIRPADGYDAAMIGHSLLWDPLFLIWGAALCLALRFSRRAAGSPKASENLP